MKQKLESVKAAVLCGGVGAASRLLAVGAGVVAPPFMRDALAMPQPDTSALLFGLASGSVQGALFGLTYRYGSELGQRPARADSNDSDFAHCDTFVFAGSFSSAVYHECEERLFAVDPERVT